MNNPFDTPSSGYPNQFPKNNPTNNPFLQTTPTVNSNRPAIGFNPFEDSSFLQPHTSDINKPSYELAENLSNLPLEFPGNSISSVSVPSKAESVPKPLDLEEDGRIAAQLYMEEQKRLREQEEMDELMARMLQEDENAVSGSNANAAGNNNLTRPISQTEEDERMAIMLSDAELAAQLANEQNNPPSFPPRPPLTANDGSDLLPPSYNEIGGTSTSVPPPPIGSAPFNVEVKEGLITFQITRQGDVITLSQGNYGVHYRGEKSGPKILIYRGTELVFDSIRHGPDYMITNVLLSNRGMQQGIAFSKVPKSAKEKHSFFIGNMSYVWKHPMKFEMDEWQLVGMLQDQLIAVILLAQNRAFSQPKKVLQISAGFLPHLDIICATAIILLMW
ncbi:hypothetical protein HK098_000179 [Nowakowskiella sp. JEL0407]|nr:hypothetical protein HK098_000179 [Nowakowskiella sp. JEL0407]